MNSLIFPEGVTYKYKYITGGDILPKNITVTDLGNLYKYSTNNIIDIQFDPKNITDYNEAFIYCEMTNISLFDTSNVTRMSNMFKNCSNLTTVPLFDTSNVTSMAQMFGYCSNLTTIPQFDTSKVTSISSMFTSCSSLTSIPLLDCSSVTVSGILGYVGSSGNSTIMHLGGFKNLGMQKSVSETSNYLISSCKALTHESVMNVINNLYDRASAGYSVLTLKLHADVLAKLTDEEKAIATNKGWTLS